jgi:succinate dehydrogenase/fumarate reductase flavoprotein subunit
MKTLQHCIVAGLIAAGTAAAFVLPVTAAADESIERGSSFAPDFYNREVGQYHAYIARMSPENRAKLMAMQDKIMQMEMERKSMMMKMDMELEKAKRDMDFFILNAGYPFQGGSH